MGAAASASGPARSPIDTKWFKGLLSDRGMRQHQIASTLALDPASVSLMLRGKRRLQLDEAAALANLLGVPLDEVLHHAGIDPEAGAAGTVPIVGTVDDDGEVVMKRPEGPRRVTAPVGMAEGAVALRYETSDARDGCIAFYVPREGVDADAVGRVCVVQVAPAGKGVRYVRVVKRGYVRGTFTLTQVRAEKSLENVELASACPVLWLRMV